MSNRLQAEPRQQSQQPHRCPPHPSQTQLPKLFDELQITKHLDIQLENNSITVRITNHVFEDLCNETAKLELTHKTVGYPLSSALACAFAKATGKPIVIEKEETSPDKTTTVQYKVLED